MKKRLPFSQAEYDSRLSKVKSVMDERGIDVLVLTEPSNMCYVTGYDAWSFYVVQAVLIFRDHEMPVWVGRFMDAISARMTTYLPDEYIRPYSDGYVQSADKHPAEFFAQVIREYGGERSVVGVEKGAYYYTARVHEEFVAALPDATFVDAELLVNWIRIIKSEAEIAYMREAGQISDLMIRRAVEVAAPGVRECDLAAAIYQQQISGTPEFGGTYSTSHPYVCCGEQALAPHPVWSDKPLQQNTPINLEISGCRFRYHCPLSRTIYLGEPPQSYGSMASAVVDGLNEALEAVQPGVTCEEVELVWRRSMARHGIEKEARVGYTTGIGYPPTWGERTASLRPGDKTVLQPGMVFHMMTGLWLEEVGVTITQTFVVNARGHEPLTSYPRELIVKP